MRFRFLAALIAGAILAAASFTQADDEKVGDAKKPMRPDLKAKEWKKLESGLEVWDSKEGKGEAVKPGEKVKVHYTGWLTDEKGTIFDSSVVRGKPISFGLEGVIAGWQKGIPGMKPGGIRRLKIPPELAYGERASGPIPANSTLVFEVELIDDKPLRPDLKAKEWKKLESGLEVWDVKEGKGEAVKPGGQVKVHYTGWLTDEKGTIFDSSAKNDEPIEFGLKQVIKGWQEGIVGMKPGSVRRFKIPSELAYGSRGVAGVIPPDATLVFEVELIESK